MAPAPPSRKWPLACWVLLAWAGGCLAWVIAARKPWHTQALALEIDVKRTPYEDFVAAGLWIGLLVSGLLAVLLMVTHRWWNGVGAAPVTLPPTHCSVVISRRWFWVILSGFVGFVLWQCWPAMTLSFWGDEATMFTDFVHGHWARTKDGSVQDVLRFKEVSWPRAIFCDYYGANHWLSTHLQRIVLQTWQAVGHRPTWDFEEWVVRLVPLGAGLSMIVAMACWLRWLGRPLAGLSAAGFLALHPSCIRFCVEARGYSLLLLFFVLTLWAIGRALRHGRKRDWLIVGLGQFLMMYSWKGAVYGLLFVNAVVGVRLLFGSLPPATARNVAIGRWLAAGVLGAMLFIPLTTSSQLQIRKSIEVTRKRAKPMDGVWRDNLVSETVLGIPWHESERASPREVSIERLRRQSALTGPAVVAVGLMMLVGVGRLWRQDRMLASMSLGVLASGLMAAVHFKFGLRVELLTWYLVYQLPVLALLFGVAVTPGPGAVEYTSSAWRRWRSIGWGALAMAALGGFAVLATPMVKDFQCHPRENYKKATLLTRGAHEPKGYEGPSNVYTGWLWRHASAYDPRGDTHVRTIDALEENCRLAIGSGGEFYMIVGIRQLSEAVFPELMQRLRDPDRFEHLATLWGGEPLNTLDVYRMRK